MSTFRARPTAYAELMAQLSQQEAELRKRARSDDGWFDAVMRKWAEEVDHSGPGPERIYVDARMECPT